MRSHSRSGRGILSLDFTTADCRLCEGFRTTAPGASRIVAMGRHPKPFTMSELQMILFYPLLYLLLSIGNLMRRREFITVIGRRSRTLATATQSSSCAIEHRPHSI